jgi:predicted nuclease of restriction endonuclease-like (RecB) superfamily
MPKKPVPIKRRSAPGELLSDVRGLILNARESVARTVNAGLVIHYWQAGNRIRSDVLRERRAAYGQEILQTLSAKLVVEFGRGYAERNLASMVRFSEAFPDFEIVAALSRQLGWSHFVEIISMKDSLQRDFYAEMCRIERWSVRKLREKIGGMLFERTALSKKPAKLAEQELHKLRAEDHLTPDLVFRDPYFLDFLGLKGAFHEKDLEAAIIRDLEAFLVELGGDFAFLARQKRIVVDGEDFYLDLLFYHRRLRRLAAIDRTRWPALAPVFWEEANRRLRANGLPVAKFQKNPAKPVPVHPSLGKELCILCWAVEEASPDDVPNVLRNWEALAPEERWWLYTMTVASTGQAMQKGLGWRKALRAAIADNPFVKGEGLSPKARRELLGHSQCSLSL